MDRKKIDRRSQKFWLTNQNSWTRVWRQNEGNYALYKRAFLRILGKLWMVLDRREGEMVPEKKITPKSCLVPELWPVLSFTVDPENRQDDFYITVTFSLVLYSPHMQESRSNGWKIYLGALFEKKSKIENFMSHFACKIHWAGEKYSLTAYLNSWCDFLSFDMSHYIFSWKNEDFIF